MTKEKHDARDSNRGSYYQSLVAIEYAIKDEYSDFNELTIEHEGDVSFDTMVQIEVKHHKNRVSLSDTHEDFWKTLYNWINQKKEFKCLILHTTAHFPTTSSCLKRWNRFSVKQRFDELQKIKFKHNLNDIEDYKISDRTLEIISRLNVSSQTLGKLSKVKNKKYKLYDFENLLEVENILKEEQTILKIHCKDTSAKKYKVWNYQRYIHTFSFEEIVDVLNIVELRTKQPIDEVLVTKLMKKSVFKGLSCKKDRELREIIEVRLAGKIQSKVIGNKKWSVSNEQFYNAIKHANKDFFDENYLPIFDKYLIGNAPEDIGEKFNEKIFVKELKYIECKDNEIDNAIIDTWKTIELIGEEIRSNPTFLDDEYIPYRKEVVLRKIQNKKNRYDFSEDETININNSLSFYREVLDIDFPNYKSIKGVYAYFKHGTMHQLVEDEDVEFSWVL